MHPASCRTGDFLRSPRPPSEQPQAAVAVATASPQSHPPESKTLPGGSSGTSDRPSLEPPESVGCVSLRGECGVCLHLQGEVPALSPGQGPPVLEEGVSVPRAACPGLTAWISGVRGNAGPMGSLGVPTRGTGAAGELLGPRGWPDLSPGLSPRPLSVALGGPVLGPLLTTADGGPGRVGVLELLWAPIGGCVCKLQVGTVHRSISGDLLWPRFLFLAVQPGPPVLSQDRHFNAGDIPRCGCSWGPWEWAGRRASWQCEQ